MGGLPNDGASGAMARCPPVAAGDGLRVVQVRPRSFPWRAGVAYLAICVALLCPGEATALGRLVPYEDFATADQVVEVMRCGHWDAPGGEGFFRVVHAERYAQSFLYIQWMERYNDVGDIRAVHTLGVAEVNNDHADIQLDKLRCVKQARGIALLAQASLGHEGKTKSLRLDVGATPGRYRLRLS